MVNKTTLFQYAISDLIYTFVSNNKTIVFMDNDIVNDIKKEFLIQALKQWIRVNYHPVLAEIYCRQVDDAKHFAKWLEAIRKSQM